MGIDENKVTAIDPIDDMPPSEVELATKGSRAATSLPKDKGQIDELMEVIRTRTASYDPAAAAAEDGAVEFAGEETGFCNLIFKYADNCDKCLFILGVIFSTLFGMALPFFCILFGDMLDGIGGASSFDSLGEQAEYMVYMGLFAGTCSSLFIYSLSLFAVNISHKMRIDYFRKSLEKDASYYDEHNPNEVSANIARQIQSIQKGSGDKIGLVVYGVMGFFFGLGVAFYFGWLLSTILLAALPVMGGVGGVFGSM